MLGWNLSAPLLRISMVPAQNYGVPSLERRRCTRNNGGPPAGDTRLVYTFQFFPCSLFNLFNLLRLQLVDILHVLVTMRRATRIAENIKISPSGSVSTI